jgi:hypothetical protein
MKSVTESVADRHCDDRPSPLNHAGFSEPSFVDALAHPGDVFDNPQEVVDHPWFSDQEKRTVLLSWVRDELVVEQVASKTIPELKPQSRIDKVLEALSRFDPSAAEEYRSAVASLRGSKSGCERQRDTNSRGLP